MGRISHPAQPPLVWTRQPSRAVSGWLRVGAEVGDKLKGTACPGYDNVPAVTLVIRWCWALTRLFSYPKQAPSSAVPTDSVRTVCRSDPYARNRRWQIRSCPRQALKLSRQTRLYRPRSATQCNRHEHPALLRASMVKLEEYIFPFGMAEELLDPLR